MSNNSDATKKVPTPEIFIGYVHSFDFANKETKALFSPHPEVGRIYRVILRKRGDDQSYELYVGKDSNKLGMDTIVLGEELSGDYEGKWSYDISIVTKTNYLDYEFTDEDVEKLHMWTKSKHADLKKLLTKAPKPVNTDQLPPPTFTVDNSENPIPKPMMEAIHREIHSHTKREQDLQDIVKGLEQVRRFDPGLISPLAKVIFVLGDMTEEFSTHTDIVKSVIMETNSRAVAPTMALANIQNYLIGDADNRNLIMAIINLVTEMQRLELHPDNNNDTNPTDYAK